MFFVCARPSPRHSGLTEPLLLCALSLLAPQVVAAKLKIPVSSQRLFFGDTLLQDNDGSGNAKDLSQWGISTGSIVRLDRRVD